MSQGVNEVDKYTLFKGWKAKLGVAQNVALIGEDFGTLTVSLTILPERRNDRHRRQVAIL